MSVRRVVAHPAVKDDVDKSAVERGPLVYCTEGADNDGNVLAKVPGASVWFETLERRDRFGVKRDQFNRVTFTPVTTTALRLEVQL